VHVHGNATVDVIEESKSCPRMQHLDVMKVAGLVDVEQYASGIELLERSSPC
jgi:hypothetical protein